MATRRNERDWWLLTLAMYSRRLARIVRAVLNRLAKEVLAALTAIDILSAVNRVLDSIRWTQELRTAVRRVIYDAVTVAAADEVARHAPQEQAAQVARRVAPRSNALAAGLVAGLAWAIAINSFIRTIHRVVSSSLALPVPVIAARVKRIAGPAALDSRSLRIGETESHGAMNGGKEVARVVLFAEGYLRSKEWVCTFYNSRHTHIVAHGQIVPINARFKVGISSAMYPGDPNLPIEERANCNCYSRGRPA